VKLRQNTIENKYDSNGGGAPETEMDSGGMANSEESLSVGDSGREFWDVWGGELSAEEHREKSLGIRRVEGESGKEKLNSNRCSGLGRPVCKSL